MGLALLVGSIALLDWLLLKQRDAGEAARALKKWTHAGLALVFLTGPAMYFADPIRYQANTAFRAKMILLLAALAFHFTAHRRAVQHGRGRLTAVISLALWTCVVLAGRAIADFDLL
jgi:hypothetical protein